MKSKISINYEIVIIPFLLISLMWIVYWGEFVSPIELTRLGILPRTLSGIFGVIFSPLLHSKTDINHNLMYTKKKEPNMIVSMLPLSS
jgi:hypothetical protein